MSKVNEKQQQEAKEKKERKEKEEEAGEEDNYCLEDSVFATEEAELAKEQERKASEREKEVRILVPRHRLKKLSKEEEEEKLAAEKNESEDPFSSKNVEECPPLSLRHRPGMHHSLWGHLLWNAARHVILMMDTGRIKVKGRSVLELGCGIAAPSIVAYLNGARVVCATDYPDPSLLRVVAENAAQALLVDQNEKKKEETEGGDEEEEQVEFDLEKMDEKILEEYFQMKPAVKKKFEEEKEAAEKKTKEEEKEKEGEKNEEEKKDVQAIIQKKKMKKKQRLNFFVEGLRWGNGDDITRLCERSGCVGFDVIILSDLMFNHVCHDALLATVSKFLSRDLTSRAYVTFSFHRPHKRQDDLRFFDKCSFYGIKHNLIEVNHDYPLMFPNDPGDPAIRKPVYVYELSLHMPMPASCSPSLLSSSSSSSSSSFFSAAAAAPIDKFTFDVVVQGTGIVETLISASCARAGLSVLHLDAAAQYGTAFHSDQTEKRFSEFLKAWEHLTEAVFEKPCQDRLMKEIESVKVEQKKEKKAGEKVNEEEEKQHQQQLQSQLDSLEFSLQDCNKILDNRELNFDTFLTPFLASSSLIDAIAKSQMAEHVEFQNVHRIVSLNGNANNNNNSKSAPPKVSRVPITKKDVFNQGMSVISPLECRRLMRFIGDLMNPSALERDTDVHRVRLSDEIIRALAAVHTDVDLEKTKLSELLSSKYSFSENLFSLVTLGGQLVSREELCVKAIPVVFSYLSSIGRYEGSTPFLAPMYSSSDVAQIFSRMSAVWGAMFCLERSVVGVIKAENPNAMPRLNALRTPLLVQAPEKTEFENKLEELERREKEQGQEKNSSATTTSATSAASGNQKAQHHHQQQHAVPPLAKADIQLPPTGIRLVLDNRQHISTKCLVLPRNPNNNNNNNNNKNNGESETEEFLRAIIVSKRPIVSWTTLEELCNDQSLDEEEKAFRNVSCGGDPLCVGFAQIELSASSSNSSSSSSSSSSATSAASSSSQNTSSKTLSATFCQWTDLLQQSPTHITVTNITAKIPTTNLASEQQQQEQFSTQNFLDAIKSQFFLSASATTNYDEKTKRCFPTWEEHVVFATSFKWGEEASFVTSSLPASVSALAAAKSKKKKKNVNKNNNLQALEGMDGVIRLDADPDFDVALERIGKKFSVETKNSKKKKEEGEEEEEDDDDAFTSFEIQTVFSRLNDSQYADETERVFRSVLKTVGKDIEGEFSKEKFPIVKGKDAVAES